MPDQLTIEAFGQKIKAKYPQYKDIPDGELGQKVLAKYPQYQASVQAAAPSIKPEERTAGNYASEGAAGIGRGLANDVTGIVQSVLHPINTVVGLRNQAKKSVQAAQEGYANTDGTQGQKMAAGALGLLENAPVIGGMVQHAEEGGERMGSPESFGAAMEGITTFGAPELAGRAVGPAARALKATSESIRKGATGTGTGVTRDLVEKTKAENATEAEKAETENADTAEKRKTTVEKVGQKISDVRAENEAKEGVASRKAALQRGVERLDTGFKDDLKDTSEKAKAQSDTNYKSIREATKGQIVAPAELQSAVRKAQGFIEGSGENLKIFNDILSKAPEEYVVSGGAKFGPGTPLYESVKATREGLPSPNMPITFADLQGYYSELGNKLSAGNLPGDVYTALKDLRQSIDGQMQAMADKAGVGPQLSDARAYHSQYISAFRDHASPLYKAMNATERGKSVAALAGKDQTGIATLAKYNPELARRANALRGYAAEANSLKPSAARATDPTLPPNTAPVEPKVSKISPGEIQVAKAEALAKKAEALRAPHSRFANTIVALDLIRDAISGNAAGIAKDIAVRGIYGLGKKGAARLLENPRVVELLTKPTPADLALIPPELRQDFPEIIEAAKAQGIKVSPALVHAFKGAAMTGPMTRRLQEMRNGNSVQTQ